MSQPSEMDTLVRDTFNASNARGGVTDPPIHEVAAYVERLVRARADIRFLSFVKSGSGGREWKMLLATDDLVADLTFGSVPDFHIHGEIFPVAEVRGLRFGKESGAVWNPLGHVESIFPQITFSLAQRDITVGGAEGFPIVPSFPDESVEDVQRALISLLLSARLARD